MARPFQTIGLGTTANDGTGDTARAAGAKINNIVDTLNAGAWLLDADCPNTRALLGRGTGTDSYIVNPADNTIDGSATCYIGGGGSASFPNKIGSTTKPAGVDFAPGDWDDDSALEADTSDVATIGGGYDNVNNQLAGTICGGGHNYLMGGIGSGQHDVNAHSTICGGSYNIISGGRSFIGGGRRNSIDQDTTFGSILGGDDNEISASGYASIGGGSGHEIIATSTYATIAGGQNNSIDGAIGATIAGGVGNSTDGQYSSIAGGTNNAIGEAAGAAVFGGRNHVVSASGDYSAVAGSGNTVGHEYGLTVGVDAVTLGATAFTLAHPKIVEVGDAQTMRCVTAARTTNATATNLTTSGVGSYITFEAGKSSAFTGRVTLIGVRDGSADGNNDADYAQGSWALDFGGYWDGTNGLFYDASGTTTLGASPVRALTAIRDNITAGTVELRLSTGGLRVNVTGVAATIINWVAVIEIVMTKVS